MAREVEFNVNYFVKVKLTESGIAILKKRHGELDRYFVGSMGEFNLKIDKDGWYKIQMHELMHVFGQNVTVGSCFLPFETEIILCTEG